VNAAVTTVTTRGDREGYELGFTQLAVMKEKTLYYRGLDRSHGSKLVSWPRLSCADMGSVKIRPFVDTWPFAFPPGLTRVDGSVLGDPDYDLRNPTRIDLAKVPVGKNRLALSFADDPAEEFASWDLNHTALIRPGQRGAENFLRHVELEWHFCTLLILRGPDNSITQIGHCRWDMKWSVHFNAREMQHPHHHNNQILLPPSSNYGRQQAVVLSVDDTSVKTKCCFEAYPPKWER
jgi:hypothetical protein